MPRKITAAEEARAAATASNDQQLMAMFGDVEVMALTDDALEHMLKAGRMLRKRGLSKAQTLSTLTGAVASRLFNDLN